MSTKIYDAYRIRAGTLDEAVQKLQGLRPAFLSACEAEFIAGVSGAARKIWCDVAWGLKSVQEYNDEKKQLESESRPFFDYTPTSLSHARGSLHNVLMGLAGRAINKENTPLLQSSVFIFTHANNQGKNVFYAKYQGPDSCKHIMKTSPFLEDFFYWNNTDRPDNISHEDWDERKTVWGDLLKDTNSFSESGIGLPMVGSSAIFKIFSPQASTADPMARFHMETTPEQMAKLKKTFMYEKFIKNINADQELKALTASCNNFLAISVIHALARSFMQDSPELLSKAPSGGGNIEAAYYRLLSDKYASFFSAYSQARLPYPMVADMVTPLVELERVGEEFSLHVKIKDRLSVAMPGLRKI